MILRLVARFRSRKRRKIIRIMRKVNNCQTSAVFRCFQWRLGVNFNFRIFNLLFLSFL